MNEETDSATTPAVPSVETSGSSKALFQSVYDELHRLAVSKLRQERPGQTLQPTALVNEVFLRLVAPDAQRNWENVAHFFSAAAIAMRRILIENARKKHSLKRGGDHERVEVEMDQVAIGIDDEQLIRLDDALSELARQDPTKAKLIELRFFAGMTMEQACDVLGVSRATAHRYWNQARAWLFLQIAD